MSTNPVAPLSTQLHAAHTLGAKLSNIGVYPNSLKALQQLIYSMNDLQVVIARIDYGLLERQRLIERQIAERLFAGSLHDDYHEVTQALAADLSMLFRLTKSSLNHIPLILSDLIPAADRRNLRMKSFGSFLHSYKKEAVSEEFDKLIAKGVLLDKTVNNYRDKFLEHPQSSRPANRGMATEAGHIAQWHYDTIAYDYLEPIRVSGGNAYSIHVHVRPTVPSGTHVSKGQQMGTIDDGGNGHFDRFSSHIHVFLSPNLMIGLRPPGRSVGGMTWSPTAAFAIQGFVGFLDDFISEASLLSSVIAMINNAD